MTPKGQRRVLSRAVTGSARPPLLRLPFCPGQQLEERQGCFAQRVDRTTEPEAGQLVDDRGSLSVSGIRLDLIVEQMGNWDLENL